MTAFDLNNPLSLLGGRFHFSCTLHRGTSYVMSYSFSGTVQGVLMVSPESGYPVELLILEDGLTDPEYHQLPDLSINHL